ncbi:hypothetical protein [Sulfitobacter mediterraneus]|uniref:hypothetical protein n=1 Tax=Sulfitobacter mediterraneus TaxID=83219 RepID=UPI0004684C1B|nr:hypothetical protein [Sulfitobacter mediterraneus]
MDIVWDSIDWNWHDHPCPDEGAVALATELLKATKRADVFPTSASSGKFPTVCLFWQNGRVEVEVFSDSFELYFLPDADDDEMFTVSEFEATSLSRVVQKIKEAISTSNT